MNIDSTDMSCGIYLICGINYDDAGDISSLKKARAGWEESFKYAWDCDGAYQCTPKGYWFLFSDNDEGFGEEFAKFVEEMGWGKPKPINNRRTRNPNSGNMIKTWAFRFTGSLEAKKKRKSLFHYRFADSRNY